MDPYHDLLPELRLALPEKSGPSVGRHAQMIAVPSWIVDHKRVLAALTKLRTYMLGPG
jgi:hypothetical protein